MIKKLLFMLCLVTASAQAQQMKLVGSFQGWNLDNGVVMSTTDNVNFTLTNYTIEAATLKFVLNSSWGTAYGYQNAPGFPTGTGALPGTDIPVPAGTYNISFNLSTLAYSFTAGVNPNAEIHISGSGLGGSNYTLSTTDGITYSGKSFALSSGTISISQANTTNVWGSADFPSGTAVPNGPGIATPSAGVFNFTFNKNTGAYSFTPTVVSLIGVGSPSGSWDVDTDMASTDGINYTLNNAVITAGAFKIRDNHLWTWQFGYNGTTPWPTGTAQQNGNDMMSQSGTYNISFNRVTYAYTFANALGVNDERLAVFSAFPNPSNTVWTVQASGTSIGQISVRDLSGKRVVYLEPNAETATIDATALATGVYFAQVTSGDKSQVLKLVRR